MFLVIAVIGAAFLAYVNGANDVSKGVATLSGSGLTSHKKAIWWGTLWTIIGSVMSLWLAGSMLSRFTSGFIQAQFATPPAFTLAVILGAASWVLIATLTHLPVSTTHSLVGAVCTLGVTVFGLDALKWSAVATKIFSPLLLAPLVSGLITYVLAMVTSAIFEKKETVQLAAVSGSSTYEVATAAGMSPSGRGLSLADGVHWASAAGVCLARALNDMPKIMAFLLIIMADSGTKAFGQMEALILMTAAMAAGSLFSGLGVLKKLGDDVAKMTPINGMRANIVTAFLVAFAARYGLPVSTTHTATGAIVAQGIRTKSVDWKVVRGIAMSWVVTLPVSGILAVAAYFIVIQF